MKKTLWMSLFLGLCLMVGCGQPASSSEPAASQTSQAVVITHDSVELSQLQTLKLDLTILDAVYVVEYASLTDLAKVQVLTEDGETSLREMLGDSAISEQRVVLGAEPALVDEYLAGQLDVSTSSFQHENGIGVSTQALRKVRCCDSCVDLGGGIGPLVCSGCRGCDD